MTSHDEIRGKLQGVFQEVFGDPTITISDSTTARDVPDWDSLSHIRLILSIQKAFGLKFAASETGSLKNVGELCELIKAKSR